MWFARVTIRQHNEHYGAWIPTGLTALVDAKFYIATYYSESRVIEWLCM